MRKSNELTDLQKQIIDIVSKIDKPTRFFKEAGVTGRCVTYWISGQRQPSELTAIEDALNACGYELKIERKPQTDCPWK